jgi:2-methylcitrate dehydratase PrpD
MEEPFNWKIIARGSTSTPKLTEQSLPGNRNSKSEQSSDSKDKRKTGKAVLTPKTVQITEILRKIWEMNDANCKEEVSG